jgi:hypothetical protein
MPATSLDLRRVLRVGLATVACLVGAAGAQVSVHDALPATTVAAFYAAPGGAGLGVVQEVLDGLDVDAFLATLAALGGEAADASVPGMGLGGLGVGDLVGSMLDEIAAECPDVAGFLIVTSDVWDAISGPSVVAVSISPFNPMPGVLAVARPRDAARASELQDALIACFGSGLVLQEGAVSLHVIGDGSDQPLVLARTGGLFIAATDPELARSAVRLASGADEPRFTDGAIGRASAPLMAGGLGLAIDMAALADALEGLRGVLPGAEFDPLVDRALASLRTVGGFAASMTIDDDGVRFESVLTVDPSGGDVALARLLACDDCRPAAPSLVPAGVTMLDARVVPIADAVAWLDGWLAEASSLVGETLDVRSLVREFLGLDLDALLLDWVGTTFHTAQVEPLGTDARTWLSGGGSITTIPVRDEAAALVGLEGWKAALVNIPGIATSIEAMFDPFAAFAESEPAAELDLLSVRAMTYRGVSYERWRFGPTIDVAVGVFGSHLVLASPAPAMRRVIDVHHGAPSIVADPVLGGALAGIPAQASSYAVADVARALRAAAAVTDLLGAPIASAIVLAPSDSSTSFDEDWDSWGDFDWGEFDMDSTLTPLYSDPGMFGPEPRSPSSRTPSLAVSGRVVDELLGTDELSIGNVGLVYELEGAEVGDLVELEVVTTSGNFDTFLYLYDLAAGRLLAENDDAPSVDRSEIVFEVEAGVRYAVIVTSWSGRDVGPFELSAAVRESAAERGGGVDPVAESPAPADPSGAEPGEPQDDAPPAPTVTFGEVVGLFDFLTDFLEGLADRTGVAVASSVTSDGVTRSTLLIPLR